MKLLNDSHRDQNVKPAKIKYNLKIFLQRNDDDDDDDDSDLDSTRVPLLLIVRVPVVNLSSHRACLIKFYKLVKYGNPSV